MSKLLSNCVSTILLGSVVLLAVPTRAAVVPPVGYTFDEPTSCGTFCYSDTHLTNLTDGVLPAGGWYYDQGIGWNGWVTPTVDITFNFGSVVSIDSVAIYTAQDSTGDVVLPNFVVSELVGTSWQVVGTFINAVSNANSQDPFSQTTPNYIDTLSGLNIDSQYVQVTAENNGPWIFVGEVTFSNGATAAPEPASLALLGAGVGGLGLIRRRRG